MIEILDDLGVLARRELDLATMSLASVPFGASAEAAVARDQVIQVVGSPIVHRYTNSRETGPAYYGEDGRLLPLHLVVDSVLGTAGMVHFAGHVSYKIMGGHVVGFALYNGNHGHLAHFGHLATYAQFLDEFGAPDRTEEDRGNGELTAVHHSYWRARKHTIWSNDVTKDDGSGHLRLVNLGDYKGNAGPWRASPPHRPRPDPDHDDCGAAATRPGPR